MYFCIKLGEEKAYHSAFRTFVRFVLCLVLLVSSSSWCLGRAAVSDCGTPWIFSFLFNARNKTLTVKLLQQWY